MITPMLERHHAPAAARPRTQHGHVADALGRRILGGRRLSGERLPNEAELCAELGVGRGALREAVKSLEAKGLLESRPRIGTRVTDREQWNFLDADVLRWVRETRPDELARDLADLRQSVEPGAAALAAVRASPDDVTGIERAYAEMVRAAASTTLEGFATADLAFHLAVLKAAHNDLFTSLGHAVEVALLGSFMTGMQAPGAVEASMPKHELLLSAIRVGDPGAASAASAGLVAASVHDFAVATDGGAA